MLKAGYVQLSQETPSTACNPTSCITRDSSMWLSILAPLLKLQASPRRNTQTEIRQDEGLHTYGMGLSEPLAKYERGKHSCFCHGVSAAT